MEHRQNLLTTFPIFTILQHYFYFVYTFLKICVKIISCSNYINWNLLNRSQILEVRIQNVVKQPNAGVLFLRKVWFPAGHGLPSQPLRLLLKIKPRRDLADVRISLLNTINRNIVACIMYFRKKTLQRLLFLENCI